MSKRNRRGEFEHVFEGPEVLAPLLASAGCKLSLESVAERMRAAQREGKRAGDVIPSLFEGEPRFGDPFEAQLTFQNLLGLWDLIASGKPLPKQKAPGGDRPPRPKKPEPVHPGAFGEAPSPEWVERAWQYLEDLGEKGRTPLLHSFENRQDALLTWLDDSGLPDDGYLVARHLLFELHAMIELGWPAGFASAVPPPEVPGAMQEDPVLDPALNDVLVYVDEALFEAEHDDEAPLPPGEAKQVRERVVRGLGALWAARRPPK